MHASEHREKDYNAILTDFALKPISGERHNKMLLSDYDVVILAGDMNSRLNLSKTQISAVLEKIYSGQEGLIELLRHDEITRWRQEEGAFSGFREAPITFPPTYKYMVDGDEYDVGQFGGSKHRVPAWCDRVLFDGPVNCLKYDHCPSIKASDHKPVIAVLELT